MTYRRMVNGEYVEMTEDEIAARQEDEARAYTTSDVDAKRDRLIDGGFIFQGKRYQSRDKPHNDRENIIGASVAALGAIVAGAQVGDLRWSDPAVDFTWIAEDNTTTTMDAQTVFAFGQAALAHKAQLIYIAAAIKAEMRGETYVGNPLEDERWGE